MLLWPWAVARALCRRSRVSTIVGGDKRGKTALQGVTYIPNPKVPHFRLAVRHPCKQVGGPAVSVTPAAQYCTQALREASGP